MSHTHPTARPVSEPLEPRRLLAAVPAAPLLFDINTNTHDADPTPVAVLNHQVVYAATTPATGRELFRAPAAAGGPTRVLTEPQLGPASSNPQRAVVVNNRPVFWAADASDTYRVYINSANSNQSAELLPGFTRRPQYNGDRIVSTGTRAYFYATDDPTGAGNTPRSGIYSTDGTVAGTRFEAATDAVFDLLGYNTAVYFVAGSPFGGSPNGPLYRLQPSTSTTAATVTQLTPAGVAATYPLAGVGDAVYFSAANRTWRSAGTPATTAALPNSATNVTPGRFQKAVLLPNGRTVFTAGDPGSTRLFARNLDGTVTGPIGFHRPTTLAVLGAKAYFDGEDSLTGRPALWSTDGTAAGTTQIKTMAAPPAGTYSTGVYNLTTVGTRLVFGAAGAEGAELWSSDGTASGTALLKDIHPGTASSYPTAAGNDRTSPYFTFNGRAYFAATHPATGVELWSTDGTAAETVLYTDTNTATHDGVFADPYPLETPPNAVTFNGRAYFAADDGVHGFELWTSDGTAAGTRLVADLAPGAASSEPLGLIAHNGALYFVANPVPGTASRNVYRTDGTEAGTVRLYRDEPGGRYSVGYTDKYRSLLAPYQGKLAFIAGGAGWAVWTTDGTPAGTNQLGSVIATGTSPPEELTASGTDLYFRWRPASGALSLFRHDGTDWSMAHDGAYPFDLTDFNGTLLYRSQTPQGSAQLWAIDRARGARQLPVSPLYDIEVVNGTAYVSGQADGSANPGLWTTDGTPAGTRQFWQSDTNVRPPIGLHGAAGKLYFFAGNRFPEFTGYEPWVSDGTWEGTRLLADINPGHLPSIHGGDYPVTPGVRFTEGPDGLVYFQANSAADGTMLYRTDGTPAGTTPVVDLAAGALPFGVAPVMLAGGKLFVVADDGLTGREWHLAGAPRTDPRVAGRFLSYDTAPAPAAPPRPAGLLALRPGETASRDNYTHHADGITTVLIDLASLPAGATTLSLPDFTLHTGNGTTWTAAPQPRLSIFPDAGTGNSDRVALTWSTGTLKNTWLRVTVNASASTGLTAPDTFYFGTLPGDTRDGAAAFDVDAADYAATRARVGSTTAAAQAASDFNRDGRIDAADVLTARLNQRRTLPLFTAPATANVFGATPISAPPRRTMTRPARRGLLEEITAAPVPAPGLSA